ncbi:hypothetical protein M422DRAFT_44014 [Sphaerobolus stellatus SS14]|nr:hypothetical protein M422DRAFT_44014 [Sphaerobolus stellatus SS14]
MTTQSLSSPLYLQSLPNDADQECKEILNQEAQVVTTNNPTDIQSETPLRDKMRRVTEIWKQIMEDPKQEKNALMQIAENGLTESISVLWHNLEEWKIKDTAMQQELNSQVEAQVKRNSEERLVGLAEDGETLATVPPENEEVTALWSKDDQAFFFCRFIEEVQSKLAVVAGLHLKHRSLPSPSMLWRQALGKDNDFMTRFKIAQSLFVGDNPKVVQARNFLNSEGGKLAIQAVAKPRLPGVPGADDIEPDEALIKHMSDEVKYYKLYELCTSVKPRLVPSLNVAFAGGGGTEASEDSEAERSQVRGRWGWGARTGGGGHG